MENIGGVFGIIGLICIIYLALRPTLQSILKWYGQKRKTIPNLLQEVYKFLTKTHRYAGFIAVGAIILHFLLQYQQYGIIPAAGLIAGLLLVLQSFLGFGLTKQKNDDRKKKMALLHRSLGFLIILAVLVHRIAGG